MTSHETNQETRVFLGPVLLAQHESLGELLMLSRPLLAVVHSLTRDLQTRPDAVMLSQVHLLLLFHEQWLLDQVVE